MPAECSMQCQPVQVCASIPCLQSTIDAQSHHVGLPSQYRLCFRVGSGALGRQELLDKVWLGLQGALHKVCPGRLCIKEPGNVRLQIIDWHAVRDFEGGCVQLQSSERAAFRQDSTFIWAPSK